MVRPEPGAAVLPRGRRIRLDERAEDFPLLVFRDADAGVSDRKTEPHVILAAFIDGDVDADLALIGELDCVGDQVEDDLPQASRIADERVGHVGRDAAGELQSLLIGARREQFDAVFDRVAEVKRRPLERQPARLDLRDIQDVVDDRHQRLGRFPGGVRCTRVAAA